MLITQTRRRFLATVSMAGGAVFLRAPPVPAAEGALETTTVRLLRKPTICGAPQYVAEELLRAEGFTDISYTKIASSAEVNDAIIQGRADFDAHFAPQWVSAIDGGGPISVLGGVHVGCFELFGNERVRRITDLKGKIVGVEGWGRATICSCPSWPPT
jgi:NitT/TauT family transport system substrate-binding protein